MQTFLIVLLAGLGFSTVVCVALRPHLFWPFIFGSTIVAADLMILQYDIVDDFLVACIIFGAFLNLSLTNHLVIKFNSKQKGSSLHRVHLFVFTVMIFYMMVQAFRGMIVLESISKIRWVFYYGMLILIPFISSNRKFTFTDRRKLNLLITLFTLFYLAQYLSIVFITEIIYGISRWSAQAQGNWMGSSYALFPLVVTMPAIIYAIIDKSKTGLTTWGFTTLSLSILAAFIAQSRATLIPLLAIIIISAWKVDLKTLAKGIVIVLSIMLICISTTGDQVFSHISLTGKDLIQTFTSNTGFSNAREQPKDLDRLIHIRVAVQLLHRGGIPAALFGYGYRVEGYVMAPYISEAYNDYLPHLNVIKELGSVDDVATFGISAVLVGTGYIGMMLLLINFLLTGFQIIVQSESKFRLIFLLSLAFLFAKLFANNYLSHMLFFIAIMPSGLLLQLNRYQPMLRK